MLCLLSSMKEETILRLKVLDLEKDAETIKTVAAILKTQLNIVSLLSELPAAIKNTADVMEQQKRKKESFEKANEPDFVSHKKPAIVAEGVN